MRENLRQLTMTVPEYEWLTNAGTIVRLAEESAAGKGWVLGTQSPTVEADEPGRLALCWLAKEHPDGAPGAYEDLFRRRQRELAQEQPYFTYWVVGPTWDQMEPEVRDHFKEFALMVCRHEGHLVMSACKEVREEMGNIPVVGLRWMVAHRREVVDVTSALV